MIADMIEEFEADGEPWYNQHIDHGFYVAAELGKTLLERNRELEHGLQQLNGTNQEQFQEIEHLSKQVSLLRTVNDQHAKVYEQLDVAARDLEQINQKLALENRSAHQHIQKLTDTVVGLQTQVEELQKQVEDLRSVPPHTTGLDEVKPWRSPDLQGGSQVKEQNQSDKSSSHKHCAVTACFGVPLRVETSGEQKEDEESLALRHSVQGLQAQLRVERALRQAAEQEVAALLQELAELEPQLALLGRCQARLAEVEAEAQELQQLWCSGSRGGDRAVLLACEEEVESGEMGQPGPRNPILSLCSSESLLRSSFVDGTGGAVGDADCEQDGTRDPEEVKQNCMSWLNEMDAHYSALQVKYDTLLQCHKQQQQQQSQKAMQIPAADLSSQHQTATSPTVYMHSEGVCTEQDAHLPEYKALFHKVFACIEKGKESLRENRAKTS